MMRPVLIVLQVTYADIDADGVVGPLTQPVQLSISPKEWLESWYTPFAELVLSRIVEQLDEAAQQPEPAI